MQKEALQQLANLRAQGNTKGLVVSATGTGKTYLGAFDVKANCSKASSLASDWTVANKYLASVSCFLPEYVPKSLAFV